MSDTGIDMTKLIEGCKAAQQKALEAASKAMDVFAEHVVGDAQQMTPVETGALKGSGIRGRSAKQVAADVPIEVSDTNIEKTIGFNTSYAAAVHESVTARHPKGGQAKFLEAAIRNNAPKLENFVGQRVQKALGGS